MKIENIKKATKDYKCNFYSDQILKGEGYRKLTLTPWDFSENDGFSTIRTHFDCVKYEKFFYDKIDNIYIYEEDYSAFKEYRKKQIY